MRRTDFMSTNVSQWQFLSFDDHSNAKFGVSKTAFLVVSKISNFLFLTCWLTKIIGYKDKPLKMRKVLYLKIAHLKYRSNRVCGTFSSRPLIPPPLKRLVKAVERISEKTRCEDAYIIISPYLSFLGKVIF